VPLALRHRVDQETIKKVTAHLAGLAPRVESSAAAVAAAVTAKPRFPTISFGGAAVGALPRQPGGGSEAAAADIAVDKLTAGDSQPFRHDWATQYPPRPAQHAIGPEGWFGRTLTGLRRNLGLPLTDPVRQPEGGAGLAGRDALQPALTPARHGRLHQRAEPQPSYAPKSAASAGARGAAAGGEPASGAEPDRKQIPDPLTMPHLAPSAPARSITAIQPHDLIRTEEELGRR
jgi:hypothetical protein